MLLVMHHPSKLIIIYISLLLSYDDLFHTFGYLCVCFFYFFNVYIVNVIGYYLVFFIMRQSYI